MNSTDSSPNTSLPDGRDLPLPWHLTLPGDLEPRLRGQLRADALRQLPWASALMLLVMGTATLVEYWVDSSALAELWRPRLVAVLGIVGVLMVAQRMPRLTHLLLCAAALCVALPHIYLGTVIDHPLAQTYFYLAFLAILSLSTLYRVPMSWALPTTLLILAASAGALWQFQPLDARASAVVLAVMACGSLMSLTGLYVMERLQRRFFLSEQLLFLHRSELHEANQTLASEASEDSLTGTINRRGLDSRLAKLLHGMQYQSRGAPDSISVLIFDIDYFKQYNDTYGHQQGDECLKAIASVPKTMVQRSTDFVARYGGEEFVVVLGGTRLADALVFAERMRARVEQLGIPHLGSRSNSVVTISIGVASTSGGAHDADKLIQQADAALYEAKAGGRNCVASVNSDGALRVLRRSA
ncbi:GGDEF domain-containing protein [Isoalcanivorax beigongshangi]|uniref:diguanylate cyclase n=1 Tax=Isoalcanivorax beigongshangi TaxID=3238810 RepID=A0ABV4AE16_9GAMM